MISIIIPYFKSKKTIHSVVNRIVDFLSQEKTDYEVILINDGACSSDDILEKIKLLNNVIIITNSRNRGPAFCRNMGAQYAKGDVLAFVDSDMLVNENVFSLILRHFGQKENQNTVLVGVYSKETYYKNFYSIHYNQRIRYGFISNENNDAPPINAGIFSLKKEVFESVGGFWNKFKGASVEDIELGKRFEKNGIKIKIIPELSVCHVKYMNISKHLLNDFKRSRDRCEFLFDVSTFLDILKGKGFEYTKNDYLMSAMLCLLFWSSLIVSIIHPHVLILSLLLAFCVTYLNRNMLAFFRKECGDVFTFKAALFQFVDLLCAVSGVVWGTVKISVEKLYGIVKETLNLFVYKKYPISLVHFVTETCNLNCGHCFIEKTGTMPKEDELSAGEIDKASYSFRPYLKNVIVTGGEPFLREDLTEICLSYANNTSVKTILIPTNGSFMNELEKFIYNFKNKCRRSNVKVYFVISLDGPSAVHNRLRNQNGLYEKALAFYSYIEKLNDPMFIPNVQLTITNLNYLYANDFYDYLTKDLKINNIGINLIRRQGRISQIEDEGQIYKVYKELNNKNLAFLKKNFNTFEFILKFTRLFSQIRSQLQIKMYFNKLFPGTCPAGGLFLTIKPNGDIYPCEILKERTGSMRDVHYDVTKILFSEKHRQNVTFIKKNKCTCTYECALAVNIMSQKKFWVIWGFKYFFYLVRFQKHKSKISF